MKAVNQSQLMETNVAKVKEIRIMIPAIIRNASLIVIIGTFDEYNKIKQYKLLLNR